MFQVNARMILELGSELISSDIIAFYELIKNGFDAGSQERGVEIKFQVILGRNIYLHLYDLSNNKEIEFPKLKENCLSKLNASVEEQLLAHAQSLLLDAQSKEELRKALKNIYGMSTITVSDNGSGMSKKDLVESFLVVGTDSRKKAVDEAMNSGAETVPFLGEKGIGRLSAMRLGDRLRVETARTDDKFLNILEINWNDFAKPGIKIDKISIQPTRGSSKSPKEWSGTKIIISELVEDWSKSRLTKMAKYDFARLTNPFFDPKQRPRIILYWDDERISIPWMSRTLIENAHARIVGKYSIENGKPTLHSEVEVIDLGFDHPRMKEKYVISNMDLSSTVGGSDQIIPDFALISLGPFNFEMNWFNRRRLSQIDGIGDRELVKELQKMWSGILLYRDGFRIFPYGDDGDDWLSLDRKAFSRKGYTLNKTQFVGHVDITRTKNPRLVDQTNREGLRETPEQQTLLRIIEYVIDKQLFEYMKQIEREYKSQKIAPEDTRSQVNSLTTRTNKALTKLNRLIPKEEYLLIENLRATITEFSELVKRSQTRIDEVESEKRQMIELAGVGLMIEVVAHELARVSENAMENLSDLRGRSVPQEIETKLNAVRSQMKSLGKRLRILDPLSISGRQRKETFFLGKLIEESIAAHEGQFARHKIQIHFTDAEPSVSVKAVRGMITQVVENLISNSVYWLGVQKNRHPNLDSIIRIYVLTDPPSIQYEDNGPGISQDNCERVFQPFFSLKEKTKRRGLGLYIAKENAEYHGGTLVLTDKVNPDTERLNTFLLELP